MSESTLYAIGTIAAWIGSIAVIRLVYLAARLLFNPPGIDRDRTQAGLVLSGLVAAAGLLVGYSVPMSVGRSLSEGWKIPLVWFVMPFLAWLCVAATALALFGAARAWLALTAQERRGFVRAAAAWAIVAGAAYWQFRRTGGKVDVLRGALVLQSATVLVIAILAVAGVVAMVLSARATRSRGFAKAVVTHAALLAGTVLFGLPFAWLVITSFKEDRDMSSPNGLVWIPKVEERLPYLSAQNPVYEGKYMGRTVRGNVLETKLDGSLRIDIVEPANLRGYTFDAPVSTLKIVPKYVPVVTGRFEGKTVKGMAIEEMPDGRRRVSILEPASLAGKEFTATAGELEPVRHVGLNWENYPKSLQFLPLEADMGLVYLKNTLIIVVMTVIGTVLSCSIVAYAFSRLSFPGKNALFILLLSTMMLPGAVTLLPKFLIFRQLGWIDSLYPMWVPSFFASAFNVFLLRQFFMSIPMELEDAAKIDGCSYLRTFWQVMMPQIKPAIAVIAVAAFVAAWNSFMDPLIYISSPENMPISYALQMFSGDRSNEPGLVMAFATMAILPVLALFFFAQRYFIENVTLSGLGGR